MKYNQRHLNTHTAFYIIHLLILGRDDILCLKVQVYVCIYILNNVNKKDINFILHNINLTVLYNFLFIFFLHYYKRFIKYRIYLLEHPILFCFFKISKVLGAQVLK